MLLKLDEVKRQVGLGKSMIDRLIGEGKLPKPHKLAQFASRWNDREIARWIDEVKAASRWDAIPDVVAATASAVECGA